jgi:hypothetical protein
MKRHKSSGTEDGGGDENHKDELMAQEIPCNRLFSICLKLSTMFVLVLAVAFATFHSGMFNYDFAYIDTGLVTPDISLLFDKYDTNADGKLDIFEFEPLAHRVLTTKVHK